jgi:hypothetical protein
VREGEETPVTEYRDFMTWVNDRPFTSGFFFQHIRTPEVDIAVDVEGAEAVLLSAVSAHAHPDVVYRVFEHGMVLANPSRAPYEFDLKTLSPGRKYARIPGTATQDPQTNNGSAVGATIVLGERDGLFLRRLE